MIKFRCLNCNQKIGVPDEKSGKKIKCPKCGNVNLAPQEKTSPFPQIESIPIAEEKPVVTNVHDIPTPVIKQQKILSYGSLIVLAIVFTLSGMLLLWLGWTEKEVDFTLMLIVMAGILDVNFLMLWYSRSNRNKETKKSFIKKLAPSLTIVLAVIIPSVGYFRWDHHYGPQLRQDRNYESQASCRLVLAVIIAADKRADRRGSLNQF